MMYSGDEDYGDEITSGPLPDETPGCLGEEPEAERAKRRPANYRRLSPRDQWAIDKELGILDWDGK